MKAFVKYAMVILTGRSIQQISVESRPSNVMILEFGFVAENPDKSGLQNYRPKAN